MNPTPKSARESRLILSQLMLPEHANTHGNVHGGWIMKLADEEGGLCATRHARRPCVTVAMDSMTFKQPVRVGELLELTAEVTWTGRTSIEVIVNVTAENPLTGDRVATNSAFLVYVALDERGRPTAVPPYLPESDEERTRMEQARKRQEYRVRTRKADSGD